MRYIEAADYHPVGLGVHQFISCFQKKKGNRSVKYHNEISVTGIRRSFAKSE